MNWPLTIAIMVGVAATAEDLYRRRISNTISVAALLLGLAVQTTLHGLRGAGDSLAGTVAGFLVFFIFFLLGGMGGGDIKLMAGFGAVVGWSQILMASLLTAIVGALFAMAFLLVRKLKRNKQTDAAAKAAEAIPYAPAITLGVLLSFAAR